MFTLEKYQQEAKKTDRHPDSVEGLNIALFGLVGEAGSLLTEYKKQLRDGDAYSGFRSQVAEELGDLLWYLTTVATRMGLSLDEVARENLAKVQKRWLLPEDRAKLFDEDRQPAEQLPRQFEYRYEYREVKGKRKAVLIDEAGRLVGDPLTDNSYEDDGYRFHDIIHIAHAVVLGWSPVLRKLLGRKRKSNDDVDHVDEVEDGARAQLADELVVAATYEYAMRHDAMRVKQVDWDLLRLIKRLTSRFEVRVRTEREWEEAILLAFKVWREVRKHDGGCLRGDLIARTLEFVPPTEPATRSPTAG